MRAQKRGRNSAVECQLPKLDVVGSNPIARFQHIGVNGPAKSFIFNGLLIVSTHLGWRCPACRLAFQNARERTCQGCARSSAAGLENSPFRQMPEGAE